MKLTDEAKKIEINNQILFFAAVSGLLVTAVLPFYYIALYKATDTLSTFFVDRVFIFIGLWMGIVIFSFLVDRLGYVASYKVSYALQAVSFVVIFLLFDRIDDLFILFALLIGISRGTFWPIFHSVMLKEFPKTERGSLLNVIASMYRIQEIFIPIMVGAMIQFTGRTEYIFGLTAIVYFAVTLVSWRYNKKPRSKIQSKEINSILKSNTFKLYSIVLFADDAINMMFASLLFIVPFILIGSEFGVGIFATVMGVVAALSSYYERNQPERLRITFAYGGYLLHGVMTVALSILWTVPALAVRGMSATLMGSISTPVMDSYEMQTRAKILGDTLEESAIELNMIMETIRMLSRVTVFTSVFILVEYLVSDPEDFIRIFIFIIAFAQLVTFTLMQRLAS